MAFGGEYSWIPIKTSTWSNLPKPPETPKILWTQNHEVAGFRSMEHLQQNPWYMVTFRTGIQDFRQLPNAIRRV